MTHSEFQAWLDRYVAAWKSYDPAAIGELFAEQAEYRYRATDEPVRGRDAIVADWLSDRYQPGTYDGHYEPLAIEGKTHVASGWSRDFGSDGELTDEYSNIFVCRFDAAGQCTSFTDWWTRNRKFDSNG